MELRIAEKPKQSESRIGGAESGLQGEPPEAQPAMPQPLTLAGQFEAGLVGPGLEEDGRWELLDSLS